MPKKFFTLIEILSAVLIISFLVMFIVPNVGAVKDTAKTAGVDTNQRMIEAYINGRIHDYGKAEVALFEKELLDTYTGEKELKNPFTKETSILEISSLNATTGAAVVYSNLDNTKSTVDQIISYFSLNQYPQLKGSVGIAAYPSPAGLDEIEVVVLPFNKNGKIVKSKIKVIKN